MKIFLNWKRITFFEMKLLRTEQQRSLKVKCSFRIGFGQTTVLFQTVVSRLSLFVCMCVCTCKRCALCFIRLLYIIQCRTTYYSFIYIFWKIVFQTLGFNTRKHIWKNKKRYIYMLMHQCSFEKNSERQQNNICLICLEIKMKNIRHFWGTECSRIEC